MPFEKDIYLALLVQHLRAEIERNKEEADRQKNLQSKLSSGQQRSSSSSKFRRSR